MKKLADLVDIGVLVDYSTVVPNYVSFIEYKFIS